MAKRKNAKSSDQSSAAARSAKKMRTYALNVDQNTPEPKMAPVPAPRIAKLTQISALREVKRSGDTLKERVQHQSVYKANNWLKHSPVFRIPGVRLSRLAARGKNLPKDVKKANKVIQLMDKAESDACSARYVDEDGRTLACVFAYRSKEEAKSIISDKNKRARDGAAGETELNSPNVSKKPLDYPGPVGRTWDDMPLPRTYDGIPEHLLTRSHEATQQLHHTLHPKAHKRDVRHPDDAVLSYQQETQNNSNQDASPEHQQDSVEDQDTSPEYQRDGVEQPSADTETCFERAGVTHLVHAWHQQGHRNGRMTMSQDMHGRSCGGEMAVKYYYTATRELALHLKECFRVAFPEYYQKYVDAFNAGVWLTEDPGPWIGRAIVWKLQVETHVDGLDGGPAAIFNFGEYEGGELYLPDLKLKLRYRAGDLVIFMAGHLYHRISDWRPKTSSAGAKVTPGRVGNVFFFPEATLEALDGKPANWSRDTIGGLAPDSSQ